MADEPDIHIELQFKGAQYFPAQLLLGIIEAVDRAIARAERDEIDEIEKVFSDDIPKPVFDAMRYRAQNLTARSLNFESASSGSIILAGIAAALAYWLLDKTLGETLKESWKNSNLHSRMKEFLSARMGAKAARIAKDIRPSRFSGEEPSVEVQIQERSGMTVIVVIIVAGPGLLTVPKIREFAT
jgi:hypothetical protein